MKKALATPNAPAAIGPYSQAIEIDSLIFTSGQIPLDPTTGTMPETIEECTRQSLENIRNILASEGLTMDHVLTTTVLLQDISDFGAMNQVYATFFEGVCPARAAFQVAALPKGALVEIEAIASKE